MIWVVLQSLPEFADNAVDIAVGIDEDAIAPERGRDFIPGD